MHRALLAALVAAFAASCGCGAEVTVPCTTDQECGAGNTCQNGKCVNPSAGGGSASNGGGSAAGGGTTVTMGCDPAATDNSSRDTDCDGLSDAEEYSTPYTNGQMTNPCNADTDGDGVRDGVELGRTTTVNANCGARFVPDAEPGSRTDPTVADTDGDGIADGDEDKNKDGRVDPTESSPARKDTDCDGISDGDEVKGTLGCVTDPTKLDSDADGIPDGVEQGVQAPGADNAVCKYPTRTFDADPATKTNACNGDVDGDGIPDGAEDSNQNGKVDPGELNPTNMGDGTGPAQQACTIANLKPISFHVNGVADVQIALPPSFSEITKLADSAGEKGVMFYEPTTQVAGLVISRTPAGAAAINDEQFVRARLQGTVTAPVVQTFTTWDGFANSVRAAYDLDGNVDLKARINAIATGLVGGGATGTLAGTAGITGPFKVQAEYVRRTNNRSIILIAITPAAGFAGQRLFSLDDTTGGSALAQLGDYTAPTCEVFDATVNAKVDFMWVVDDSGSMADAQNAVNNAGAAFADKLATAGLDWRAGGVSTGYYAQTTRFRPFTNDVAVMRSWFNSMGGTASTPPWFGILGSGTERAFQSVQNYFPTLLPRSAVVPAPADKFRTDANVHLILLGDVDDQSPATVAALNAYFANVDNAGGKAVVHGIICPEGAQCSVQEPTVPNPSRMSQVIRGSGGVEGDMRPANVPAPTPAQQAQLNDTINRILTSVIGGTGHQLQKPPIASTIKVAIETGGTKGTCDANNVPRDRTNGFDFDATTRRIVFYGNCIPNAAGKKVAVSYKFWNDASPDPGGDPCGGACVSPKVCEPTSKSCVCQTNCGGTCGNGLVCDMNTCTCGPGIG